MSIYITVYQQSVKIESNDSRFVRILEGFLRQNYASIQRGFGVETEPTETLYASKIENYNVWYLLKNQFAHFISYCNGVGYKLENVEREDELGDEPKRLPMEIKDGWELRDAQKEVLDFLLDGKSNTKLVPLVTGAGKTILALFALSKLSLRTAVVILPQFIDKWVSDILEVHDSNVEDVMVIRGAKSVAGLVSMAKEGKLTHKYIIFSSRTLSNYISDFEKNPEETVDMYGCTPIELFTILGIGALLIDETHMSFHALFKILAHSNVRYHIGLSATLISEDPIVSRAHKVMYPSSSTYEDNMQTKYMDVIPTEYTISHENMRHIRTSHRGNPSYSHTAFEASIMRRGNIFDSYYKIIRECVDDYYIEDIMEGDKLVIFVSMIKMANKIVDRLRIDFSGRKIVRYCQGDSYDEMLSGDIIVSTIGSLGTGIDIPLLRTVIQTVSISSPVSNIQSAGRLRYLADRDVKLCYIYAGNIPKQREYHRKRLEVLKDRTKSVSLRRSSHNL